MSFNPNTASLNEWLAYLEELHPSVIELGLARVGQVAERLCCQKPAPLVIVVGGTNGKGTTSALLTALLQAQGLKVGQYNSPHIHRYNERVSINGQEASDAQLCASFRAVEAVRGTTSLTYFEFGTLAALQFFKEQQVDACVLEIGLGGRLDAVNLVDADISVVTSIDLDHQAFLGDTREQIAFEKCSIARAGRYLVCGEPNPPARAKATVAELGGRWCGRDEAFTIQEQQNQLVLSFVQVGSTAHWVLPLAQIPHHNVVTAIQTLALLNLLPSQELCAQIVAKLQVAGRLQRFQKAGLTLTLDVAHNEQAARYIGQKLKQVDGIILGMLADKEPEKVFPALPKCQRLILVGLEGYRGQSAQALSQRTDFSPKPELMPDVARAIAALPEQGQWLVCGSFHTVDAALEAIKEDAAWHRI